MAHAKLPGPKEKERLNDGNKNGQAMHGARKPPGPKMQIFIFLKDISLVLGPLSSVHTLCAGAENPIGLRKFFPTKTNTDINYALAYIVVILKFVILYKMKKKIKCSQQPATNGNESLH